MSVSLHRRVRPTHTHTDTHTHTNNIYESMFERMIGLVFKARIITQKTWVEHKLHLSDRAFDLWKRYFALLTEIYTAWAQRWKFYHSFCIMLMDKICSWTIQCPLGPHLTFTVPVRMKYSTSCFILSTPNMLVCCWPLIT